ncbi:MAG: hypothetical protein HY984_00300 [Candidatus Magasanikbacteria bacterium]|nr:hypothetical protein [Candidatus Magasanikbacteria bacterium]
MISNRLQRMLEHEVPLLSDAGFKQRVLDDVVAATIAATDRLLHNPPNLIEVKAWLDRAVRPI